MSKSACESKVFARSLPSLSILAQVFNARTDICSKLNRTKERASLRFANATTAPSWSMWSLRLVIKSTFSSFHLLLSSDSYSSIVRTDMHQANLSCSSVLTYGIGIRAYISELTPPLSTVNSPTGLSFLCASQRRPVFLTPSVSSLCLVSSPPDNIPWHL